MHGYFQGCPVLDELIPIEQPDAILLQEHWLTPAKLSLFDNDFVDYFAFGCSAMSDCTELGILRGRPYGGVICLVAKKLRKFATTIYCNERFTVVKIFNCLFFNVCLPCVGSINRLQIVTSILDDLSSYFKDYHICTFVMAGDFNVNLDSNDVVACRMQRLISEFSLVRCDDLFPAEKSIHMLICLLISIAL